MNLKNLLWNEQMLKTSFFGSFAYTFLRTFKLLTFLREILYKTWDIFVNSKCRYLFFSLMLYIYVNLPMRSCEFKGKNPALWAKWSLCHELIFSIPLYPCNQMSQTLKISSPGLFSIFLLHVHGSLRAKIKLTVTTEYYEKW